MEFMQRAITAAPRAGSTWRRSRRWWPARKERSALSYLNPLSYIVSETPFEDEDPKGPLANKSVVSVFGSPLFVTDDAAQAPDIFAPADANQSKGIFSSIIDSINPFSSKSLDLLPDGT